MRVEGPRLTLEKLRTDFPFCRTTMHNLGTGWSPKTGGETGTALSPHPLLCPGRRAALLKCGREGHEDFRESCLRSQLSIPELLLFSESWGQTHQNQLEVFHQAKWAPTVGGRRLSWVHFWCELVQPFGCFFWKDDTI